jgi:hypothetical protein
MTGADIWERMGRTRRIVYGILLAGGLASFILSSPPERQFVYYPKAPNPTTGHIVPIPIHGDGTVYITEAEYRPYELMRYALFADAVLLLVAVAIDAKLSRKGKR